LPECVLSDISNNGVSFFLISWEKYKYPLYKKGDIIFIKINPNKIDDELKNAELNLKFEIRSAQSFTGNININFENTLEKVISSQSPQKEKLFIPYLDNINKILDEKCYYRFWWRFLDIKEEEKELLRDVLFKLQRKK
jgi:hypothetical protein